MWYWKGKCGNNNKKYYSTGVKIEENQTQVKKQFIDLLRKKNNNTTKQKYRCFCSTNRHVYNSAVSSETSKEGENSALLPL